MQRKIRAIQSPETWLLGEWPRTASRRPGALHQGWAGFWQAGRSRGACQEENGAWPKLWKQETPEHIWGWRRGGAHDCGGESDPSQGVTQEAQHIMRQRTQGSWESEYEGFEIDGKVWNATYSQWRVIQVPHEQKRPEPSVDTHQEAMSRTTGPRESAKGDNPLGPVESDIDGRAWWEPELG